MAGSNYPQKLSHTTKGVKSALRRVLAPFFKDGTGGSILPIKITGSRSNPSFGLDLRRRGKPAYSVTKSASSVRQTQAN
jgi:hypothetical protein